MNKKILSVLCIFIAVVMLSCLGITAFSFDSEPEIIRVGIYEQEGFINLDDNGRMTGYGADFMRKLAIYANVQYEFVELSWSECMEKLLTGEIDIVTDTRKSSEREKLYGFSKQNIGQIQAALFVPKGTEDIYYNDFEKIAELRVGFEKNALNKALYEKFAEENGFTAITVEYNSDADMRKALADGEIDAFGNDVHLCSDDLKIVALYDTEPNFIMTKKNSEVLKRLDKAMQKMYADEPDLISEQFSYITAQQMFHNILLTRKQAMFLKENPVLHVAVPADRKPASWYDEELGEYTGISIEIMNDLSALTGFEFEYVPYEDGKSFVQMLNENDVDMVMPAISQEYTDLDYQATGSLYSLSIALAVKKEADLNGGNAFTVAVRRQNAGIAAILLDNYPNAEIKNYDSAQDCIDSVIRGETDAYANAVYDLEYNLQKPKNSGLHIAYSFSCPIDYCIALKTDAPKELVSILKNGISLLSKTDAEQLIRKYSSNTSYQYSVLDLVYIYRHVIFVIIMIFIAIMLLWMITYNVQKKAILAIIKKSEETERANEVKTQFLARMSHDMRTPMNGILGMTALSKDEEDNAVLHNNLEKIESAGRYMLDLINDMLDLQKQESGKLKLEMQPVYVKDYVEALIDMMKPTALAKNVGFEFNNINVEFDKFVELDVTRVKQIFVNILSNAIKFTPAGGTVSFSSETIKREGDYDLDRFIVTDTGIGMSQDFIENGLFKPYNQEDNSSTTKYGGTGLGLAITKNIIDNMGGEISVSSQKGEGTSFTIILKFKNLDNMKKEAADNQSPKNDSQWEELRGKKILMCEDHPLNTEISKRLLEKVGCEVTAAADGQIGTELFAASECGYFDAVLMDIRMPNMDGLTATKIIRSMQRDDAKKVPIIAMTANAFEGDFKECLAAGMNSYLAKPIDTKLMYETLAHWVTK